MQIKKNNSDSKVLTFSRGMPSHHLNGQVEALSVRNQISLDWKQRLNSLVEVFDRLGFQFGVGLGIRGVGVPDQEIRKVFCARVAATCSKDRY